MQLKSFTKKIMLAGFMSAVAFQPVSAQWAGIASSVAGAMIQEAARQQQLEYMQQQRQQYQSYRSRPSIRYVTKYRERPHVVSHPKESRHVSVARHNSSPNNNTEVASNPGIHKSANGGNIGANTNSSSNSVRHANF
jgi:hypothetical protein